MLEQLLAILKSGGPHTLRELAAKLDTTPELVRMMLEGLAARGHLRTSDAPCDSNCGRCGLRAQCVLNLRARRYLLSLPNQRENRP